MEKNAKRNSVENPEVKKLVQKLGLILNWTIKERERECEDAD
jgi:hypothetical protein